MVDIAAVRRERPEMIVIYIALGGAVGAVLRYLVFSAVAFPFGTLAVNVVDRF